MTMYLLCAYCGDDDEAPHLMGAFEAGWRYTSAIDMECPRCAAAGEALEREVDQMIESRCSNDPIVLNGSLTIPDKD